MGCNTSLQNVEKEFETNGVVIQYGTNSSPYSIDHYLYPNRKLVQFNFGCGIRILGEDLNDDGHIDQIVQPGWGKSEFLESRDELDNCYKVARKN